MAPVLVLVLLQRRQLPRLRTPRGRLGDDPAPARRRRPPRPRRLRPAPARLLARVVKGGEGTGVRRRPGRLLRARLARLLLRDRLPLDRRVVRPRRRQGRVTP